MKISLIIPDINACPADRPRACRYCAEPYLHSHGAFTKPIRDHKLTEVIVRRYKCLSCAKTFRHYPSGITKKDQSLRTVVLATLMYGLALSCSKGFSPARSPWSRTKQESSVAGRQGGSG